MFLEFFTHTLDRANDLTDFDIHSIQKVAAEISFRNLDIQYYGPPEAIPIPEKIYNDFNNKFGVLANLDE